MDLKNASLERNNSPAIELLVVQRLPVRFLFDTGQKLSRLRPAMPVEPSVWLR
jgi:hypothetical protein